MHEQADDHSGNKSAEMSRMVDGLVYISAVKRYREVDQKREYVADMPATAAYQQYQQCAEQSEYRAGRTRRDSRLIYADAVEERRHSGQNPGEQVQHQKPDPPEYPFRRVTKHYEGDHVVKQMHEPEVQEHVREQPVVFVILEDVRSVGGTHFYHVIRVCGIT